MNPINTVGVMGKGLALEYKKRYPAMYDLYRAACKDGSLKPGKLLLWCGPDKKILMFPTKIDWKDPSCIEHIEAGLRKFSDTCIARTLYPISFRILAVAMGDFPGKM